MNEILGTLITIAIILGIFFLPQLLNPILGRINGSNLSSKWSEFKIVNSDADTEKETFIEYYATNRNSY